MQRRVALPVLGVVAVAGSAAFAMSAIAATLDDHARESRFRWTLFSAATSILAGSLRWRRSRRDRTITGVAPSSPSLLVRTLVIGMLAAITGSTVVALAPSETTNLVRRVLIAAALMLMAVGYILVAKRVAGWRQRVLWVVAGLQLGWLIWSLARPSVVEALGEAWFDDVGYRLIAATLWWSGIVLLTIVARVWWRPATGWVVVAALVAVVLEALPWAPYLAPVFDDAVAPFEPWERPVRELLTSGAIVVVVRGILRSPA